MTTYERIKEVSEQLRQLAKEMNITIITAQQPAPAPRPLYLMHPRHRYPTVAEHALDMRNLPVFIDHATLLHDHLENE